MKKPLVKRILITICVLLVAVVCATVLFACNKGSKPLTLADLFSSATSPNEFTSYKTEFVLPAGWSVYTTSASTSSGAVDVNSDVGYIKDLDGFVVEKGGMLSIVKCGDERVYFEYDDEKGMKGMLFPARIGITALRVKDGIIVCRFSNGQLGAFDYNGKTLLSRTRTQNASSVRIDKAIKILDSGLIAVTATYDKDGKSGYTSIYRPTTSGDNSSRGELVCRVKNDENNLDYVDGFDGAYVSVVGNSNGNYMFAIPAKAGDSVKNIDSTNGVVIKNDNENYFVEITYIGGGRFFVHEDWTVEEGEGYTYKDSYANYVVKRRIYDAKADAMSDYTDNADKIFLNLTNSYYGSERVGIDVSTYLKDGFLYASYGLFIVDKVAYYDQFILDKNLNIVMSLTGNFGISLDANEKGEVSALDLVITAADGNYYVPYLPSKLAIYTGKGELVGENSSYNFKSQNVANDTVIACIEDPDGGDDELYTVFALTGDELTEEYTLESGKTRHRKYRQIAAFRGFYTIARRPDDEGNLIYVLLGKDGVEVSELSDGSVPLADIATTSSKTAIFKIGCYMFKKDSGEKDENNKTIYYYGIKNFNVNADKNVIIPATMTTGCVLYAPANSPTDVFVFEKLTATDGTVSYAVHRLI